MKPLRVVSPILVGAVIVFLVFWGCYRIVADAVPVGLP